MTARELLQKLANDAGLPYSTVARRVNRSMNKGKGLIQAVRELAEGEGLSPDQYRIDVDRVIFETEKILQEDYTQTLMISAVLGQMVESRGPDRFPAPAFFAFIEILADVPDARRDSKSESSKEIEERTTRIIELMTTLVSVVCEWSNQGIVGVAEGCPDSLHDLARAVYRKTRLLQGGLWTCISCGNIVNVGETRALVCADCDQKLTDRATLERQGDLGGRHRIGYGRSNGDS